MEVQALIKSQDMLGEGPLWDYRQQALYWVDITGKRIHRYDPQSGNHCVLGMSERITSIALRAEGSFVVTGDSGYGFWDGESSSMTPISHPEAGKAQARFNDGKIDPAGRFWAGTMTLTDASSALYCLDNDYRVQTMRQGITVSNGIDWSPDGRVMYYVDSLRYTVYAFDFDAETGQISNERTWLTLGHEEGIPDGLTVDSEGQLWLALYGGWQVIQFDSAASIVNRIKLPTQNPTSCVFGGLDLSILFITTAREGLDDQSLRAQPDAGNLFSVQTNTSGRYSFSFPG